MHTIRCQISERFAELKSVSVSTTLSFFLTHTHSKRSHFSMWSSKKGKYLYQLLVYTHIAACMCSLNLSNFVSYTLHVSLEARYRSKYFSSSFFFPLQIQRAKIEHAKTFSCLIYLFCVVFELLTTAYCILLELFFAFFKLFFNITSNAFKFQTFWMLMVLCVFKYVWQCQVV